MSFTRREFLSVATAGSMLGLAACTVPATDEPTEPDQTGEDGQEEVPEEPSVDLTEFADLELDSSKWLYDEENDIYYQLGLTYCLSPANKSLESLAIFVPGGYFTAEENGDTYTCTINEEGEVGGFTPATAPVLMPINSPNLSAQNSPTTYGSSGLSDYMEAGYVYVYAGFRGRSAGYSTDGDDVYSGGAPWPVVDLKAAVRYLRYNASVLPCDTSRVFSFGFSMGGGVSAVLGASGDSELYTPYLETIGAATHDAEGEDISDSVMGSASWCPITSFDTADAAYEWMMGQYSSDGDRADGTWTKLLSDDLAASYADSINGMGLVDSEGTAMTLDETYGEIYADGTYYAHLLQVVEDSAATFFQNTDFPYTYTPTVVTASPSFPGDPNLSSAGSGYTDAAVVEGEATETSGTTVIESVVYDSASAYAATLNTDDYWFTYNQYRESARISDLGSFVRHLKSATQGVCAFDAVDRSSDYNLVFGIDDESTLHFDKSAANLIALNIGEYEQGENWDSTYVTEWGDDVVKTDALDNTVTTRVNMFNPLYFLCSGYEGYGTAGVAQHWRVNSGLFQTVTSLCTETNLALALGSYDGVESVSFSPVWGQGQVLAEVSGTPEANLIAWVRSCLGA